LGELLAQVEQSLGQIAPEEDVSSNYALQPDEEPQLGSEDQALIERLFKEASVDRAKAYELKRELDRLNAFKLYEDRFLDLFKHP
jgi:hypothetical protein